MYSHTFTLTLAHIIWENIFDLILVEYQQFEEHRAEAEKTKTRIDPDSVVRLKIPMQACLDCFLAPDTVDDFYSSAIKGKTTAQK